MNYRYLGRTGVRVSPLCFGTMTFGKEADEAVSGELFRACREAGINFFDCADMYQAGRAEEILGGLIKDHRDEVVVTTKGFFPTGTDPNAQGASRYHLRNAVEA
ncbi:MAG TPA: aldo/keto reductase, partial [Candidatus Aminicenantes bacterium]|nr:aldo/keto reductase [Candidatus Aminicenantes bacterium]